MNKYKDFLVVNACSCKRSLLSSTYLYSKEHSIDQILAVIVDAKRVTPVQSSSLSRVAIAGGYVIKEDTRPARRRFRSSSLGYSAVKGVQGLLGEAVNTRVANTTGFPSHQLLAYQYQPLLRKTILVFEKLESCTSVLDLINEDNAEGLLRVVFKFLHDCLGKGIFHGDCNIGNIFFDKDMKQGRFIDFELAIKLNCTVGHGLALQLATLRDWRLEKLVSSDSYQEMVFSYLTDNFENHVACKELFLKFYGRRLASSDRAGRLMAVGQNNPDILSAI